MQVDGEQLQPGIDMTVASPAALDRVDPPEDLAEPDLTENARTVLERRYLTAVTSGLAIIGNCVILPTVIVLEYRRMQRRERAMEAFKEEEAKRRVRP